MENETDNRSRRIELISVLVIALTAIATAWSAFEASKWGSEMTVSMHEASTARSESVRASNLASQQTSIDVGLFSQYVTAVGRGEDKLAAFLRGGFPERLAVAADAWIATDPVGTTGGPTSPFELEEYRLDASETADRLAAVADDRVEEALQAGDTSEDYTLMSVMFATVLLFAALSTKTAGRVLQIGLLTAASVTLVVTVGVIATFPAKI